MVECKATDHHCHLQNPQSWTNRRSPLPCRHLENSCAVLVPPLSLALDVLVQPHMAKHHSQRFSNTLSHLLSRGLWPIGDVLMATECCLLRSSLSAPPPRTAIIPVIIHGSVKHGCHRQHYRWPGRLALLMLLPRNTPRWRNSRRTFIRK